MTYLLYTAAFLFALAFVLPLVCGTVAVYLTSRAEVLPLFAQRSPANMPAEVSEFFRATFPRLQAEGFDLVDHFYHAGELSKVEAFIMLMRRAAAGDVAMALSMYTTAAKTPMKAHVVSFSTAFGDGLCVSTNNDVFPLALAPDPKNVLHKFPALWDLRLLYKAHRALVERRAPGVRGVLPSEGMEGVALSTAWTKDFTSQVALGYYRMEDAGDAFRPTWKGAFLMTNKLIWPTKNILSARLKSRAASTLKSLNLN